MENYEQKYKEVLERAKKILEFYKNPAYEEVYAYAKEDIPFIFPELTESEDERIRKTLIRLFTANNVEDYGGVTNKQIVAWLEKQKLSVSYDIIEQTFNKSKTYEFPENADAVTYSESILPTSVYKGENDDEYKMHKIIESAYIEGQKQNQKPVEWTEDDEKKMKGCISAILITEWESQELQTETINWLKSLKQEEETDNSSFY